MKISVTEALRLKNVISEKIREITSKSRQVSYGSWTETTKKTTNRVVGESNELTFDQYIGALGRIYEISEELNSVLAKFNVDFGISDIVRKRSNLNALAAVYATAIDSAVPKKLVSYEIVGSTREEITKQFVPSVNKSELKRAQKALKEQVREIDSLIDKKNQEQISVSFNYGDIDSILAD